MRMAPWGWHLEDGTFRMAPWGWHLEGWNMKQCGSVNKLYWRDSGEITNNMQPCNRIYYSTVHWRLNTFRAAHCSSAGALTVFAASGLHTHVVTGRSPHAYVNQRLQIQLELLMMSSVPLETYWASSERWNNKFYYKAAYCWLFFLSRTTMHGSMNIKFKINKWINNMDMYCALVRLLCAIVTLVCEYE
jgi:hypothetical protein